MKNKPIEELPGHWLLARMGKKVLRPGGKELTAKLIDAIDIERTDHIVEFAPGLGFTASLALKKKPKSYTGVELDKNAIRDLSHIIDGPNCRIIQADASQTSLDGNAYDKVYGEAMLTMHADHRKAEIIKEAHRILKPGGYYGIHELGLCNIQNEDEKAEIQRALAKSIRVNARPLTREEWVALLDEQGFDIVKIETNGMKLLEFGRMVDDEGFFRTLKICFNITVRPKVRKRVLAMRDVFQTYQRQMNAIAIVAQKKNK